MIFSTYDNVAGPRRQLHRLAFGQRLFGKCIIAFMQQSLQQRMFRMVSLQNHFPLFACASCASGHLSIKLGKALRRAEVCGEQRAIHIQQRNQRHIREVVTFCQHLGADQDPCAAAMDFRQMLLKRSFSAGGVAVNAGNRHAGKEGG